MNTSPKVILEPTHSITKQNSDTLEQLMRQTIEQSHYQTYVLNMQRVEFLDNSGLMTLINLFKLAQSLGKQLSFCSLTPAVKIVFDISQVSGIFHLLDNVYLAENDVDFVTIGA